MTRSRPDRQRGAALFIVLAMAALLTALASAAMKTGLSGARAAAAFADAARADQLGRDAGDVVAFRLAMGGEGAERGGRLTVHLPDADVVIDYLSESARIDVNSAPAPLIGALLTVAGADPAVVAAVTDLVTQRRKQSGGTTGAPASPPRPAPSTSPLIVAPAQPAGPPDIDNILDVIQAWNLPEDVAERILPALTTENGSNQVDPTLAGHLVLLALVGGDGARADDYIERRQQGFVTPDSALALLPEPSRRFAGFVDVPAVRAIAHVTVASGFERRYDMIVAPVQGLGQPPAVVAWRKLQ